MEEIIKMDVLSFSKHIYVAEIVNLKFLRSLKDPIRQI
jgi:hypothetical protein